jgi:hypothetical protein
MSITVDEMLLAKAKLEQELQVIVADKTAAFLKETGINISSVDVYFDRPNVIGPARYVVAGVRCDLDLNVRGRF